MSWTQLDFQLVVSGSNNDKPHQTFLDHMILTAKEFLLNFNVVQLILAIFSFQFFRQNCESSEIHLHIDESLQNETSLIVA